MFDVHAWMDELSAKLDGQFGERVAFLGLQGSRHRGDAREDSDIDVVFILDALSMEDLSAYRAILRAMPHSEMACGFVSGLAELKAWPGSDLFDLVMDTGAIRGDLVSLIGLPEKEDILAGVRTNLGNLHHMMCHRYLYHDDLAAQAEKLLGAYKAVFYALRAMQYLETGVYRSTRAAVAARLSPKDRALMEVYDHWDDLRPDRQNAPETWFSRILGWCDEMLRRSAQMYDDWS